MLKSLSPLLGFSKTWDKVSIQHFDECISEQELEKAGREKGRGEGKPRARRKPEDTERILEFGGQRVIPECLGSP